MSKFLIVLMLFSSCSYAKTDCTALSTKLYLRRQKILSRFLDSCERRGSHNCTGRAMELSARLRDIHEKKLRKAGCIK